jgi:hypothetical protein
LALIGAAAATAATLYALRTPSAPVPLFPATATTSAPNTEEELAADGQFYDQKYAARVSSVRG